MSEFQAWQEIFHSWGGNEWKPIPIEIIGILRLDSRLGMCHFSLVTKIGAQGMNEFIERLNSKSLKIH